MAVEECASLLDRRPRKHPPLPPAGVFLVWKRMSCWAGGFSASVGARCPLGCRGRDLESDFAFIYSYQLELHFHVYFDLFPCLFTHYFDSLSPLAVLRGPD